MPVQRDGAWVDKASAAEVVAATRAGELRNFLATPNETRPTTANVAAPSAEPCPHCGRP